MIYTADKNHTLFSLKVSVAAAATAAIRAAWFPSVEKAATVVMAAQLEYPTADGS